ncbi:MAG: hypothetical protein KF861_01880 [Planctomycetaceae bacterium]|nr:hypothetical protein [Planctomycetaceae bacterium]
MKVTVQARRGQRAGHRVWLAARQQLHVGSTEWADFVIPDDAALAQVQFVLDCGTRGCVVRNLDAMSPLYVNGQEAVEHTLLDGDIIRAGNTEFLVSVHLGDDAVAKPSDVSSETARRAAKVRPYSCMQFSTGIVRYLGHCSLQSGADLARELNGEFACYLIVNLNAALPETAALLEGECDFRDVCLVPDDLVDTKLRLIGADSPVDRFEILQQNWGRDAVLCLFSSRERGAFLEGMKASSFLLSRPSQLGERLRSGASRLIDNCFRSVSAILMEHSDDEWGLFISTGVQSVAQRFGLPSRVAGPTFDRVPNEENTSPEEPASPLLNSTLLLNTGPAGGAEST